MQGILFIEPLYHQNKAGRKTQTRRSGSLDQINGSKKYNTNPDEWELMSPIFIDDNEVPCVVFANKIDGSTTVIKSRYKAGETLFLKEPYLIRESLTEPIYKYDNPELTGPVKWSNKLFSGQANAREFIKIHKVSLVKLLEISDADCLAEGIEVFDIDGKITYRDYMGNTKFSSVSTPKESFLSLFALANKGNNHKTTPNPWCWKYEYISTAD